jgi:alkanesulfonate monooxygenase SsuD/methylene tetrahydromethanopterin reductase-like flavin-dependent oxidoreductase (luciferase family)
MLSSITVYRSSKIQYLLVYKSLMNSKHEIKDSSVQESFANRPPLRERVGLVVDGMNAAAAVTTIGTAEEAGVRQIWMTQGPSNPDTLTIFSAAAAAAKTSTVRLGTAIVLDYTHHPLALAQQALAIHDIAPGRLRLGIGPSHRPLVEGVYYYILKVDLYNISSEKTLEVAIYE